MIATTEISQVNRSSWFLLALASFLMPLAAQDLHAPIPVEEIARMRYFADIPIGLSPDGEGVTYTLISPEEVRAPIGFTEFHTATGVPSPFVGASVWVSNLKSKQTTRLMEPGSSSWGGSWSPDGRMVAFYADRGGQAGLWIWEKETGKAHRLSQAIARPALGSDIPQWTPDSKHVVIRILPEGVTVEKANSIGTEDPPLPAGNDNAGIVVFRSPSDPKAANPAEAFWLSRQYLGDFALVNARTGTFSRIVRSAALGYSLAPDGAHLAIAEHTQYRPTEEQNLYALKVVSLKTGEINTVAHDVEMYGGGSFSWSPDGKRLAYITTGPAAKGDVYLVELNGAAPRLLTEGSHPRFGGDGNRSQPFWDSTGAKLYGVAEENLYEISSDGGGLRVLSKGWNRQVLGIFSSPSLAGSPAEGAQRLCVYTRDPETKRFGVHALDLGAGTNSKLMEMEAYLRLPVISKNGQTWAYVSESANMGPDVWAVERGQASPRRVTQVNPLLDRYVMGHSRLIEWHSLDGKPLRGALLLPADYQAGKRYPLIVWVYGGGSGSDGLNRFGPWGAAARVFNTQVLATRGYAVLYPDAPVRMGTPFKDLAATVMPGVDKVIDLGVADPDRLGVMGQSYGGYSTLALISQTTRFKAAVVSAGTADLGSSYGLLGKGGVAQSVGWAEHGQGRMGGPPWQYPERYVENSPFYHLDRVETPLLLVQGTEDFSGVTQSDEVFVGLQRLGKKVEYRQYKGEGHDLRSYANTIDFLSRKIAWFDEHLKR